MPFRFNALLRGCLSLLLLLSPVGAVPRDPALPRSNASSFKESALSAVALMVSPLWDRRTSARVVASRPPAWPALSLSRRWVLPLALLAAAPLFSQTAPAFDAARPVLMTATAEDRAAALDRYRGGDPWTVSHVNEHIARANQTPAVAAIPTTFPYTGPNADLWGPRALSCAISWRFTGRADDLAKAKAILLAMVRGFRTNAAFVTANNSLDFAVSVPTFGAAFDGIYEQLSPSDGQAAATVFSQIGDLLRTNAYGGPNDAGAQGETDAARLRRFQHLVSNIRSWQNAAAATAGLMSRRDDLVQWAIGDETAQDGGLRFHLREGYLQDEIIREGSLHYQLYDVAANAIETSAIRNAKGIDLFGYGDYQLFQSARALLGLMRPDFTIPVTGDGSPDDLREYAAVFNLVNWTYDNAELHWIVARETSPRLYRSWTTYAEAQTVWHAPGTQTQPLLGPSAYPQTGFFSIRQTYDLMQPGFWTLSTAQEHTWPHNNVNALDVQFGYNATPLSSAYKRGFLDYDSDPYNAFTRMASYNVMALNGALAPGSASFDASGPSARFRFLEEKASPTAVIHLMKAAIAGGYYQRANERAARAMLQVGAGGEPYPYAVVASAQEAPARTAAQTPATIWHGPRFAAPVVSGLSFAPIGKDPANRFFDFVEGLTQAAPTSNAWFVEWPASGDRAGIRFSFAAGRPTTVRLGIGPDQAPFLYLERTFAPQEPVVDRSLLLVEPLPGRASALTMDTWAVQANAQALTVRSPTYRDVILLSEGGFTRLANPRDAGEFLIVDGEYGYVRVTDGAIDSHGAIRGFRILAPRATAVRLDGQPVDFWREGDYLLYVAPDPVRATAPHRRPAKRLTAAG